MSVKCIPPYTSHLYRGIPIFLFLIQNIHCGYPLEPPQRGGSNVVLPGVLGIQGEGLFIFRDLGRRVIYFQGFGEKA